MNIFIKAMSIGVLMLSATTATAGYEKASFFEAFRINKTVSQEAAYQLDIETLKNISGQSSLELSELFPEKISKSPAPIKVEAHSRLAERM